MTNITDIDKAIDIVEQYEKVKADAEELGIIISASMSTFVISAFHGRGRCHCDTVKELEKFIEGYRFYISVHGINVE